MLFGRVSRKIILAHPKTISSKFSYQTRLELQMALTSTVRWNKNKLLFWQQTHQIVQTGIKSTPCPWLNIPAGSLIYIYQTLLSKVTYSAFRLCIFYQCLCSLGIEPTSFCAANAMLYHWATGTLWAYFSAGGPGHPFQIHGIMDSIKYQQIKKNKACLPLLEII